MKQTVFRADLDLVSTGLFPGVGQDKVPLWKDARNVIFDRYGARPSPGYGNVRIENGLFDTIPGLIDDWPGLFDDQSSTFDDTIEVGATVLGLAQQRTTTGIAALFIGTANKLYRHDGVLADVSRPGGYSGRSTASAAGPTSHWSFAVWGNWVLATNGADPPQIYKGTSFADIAGAPVKAQHVFVLGQHAVLANTSDGANAIAWSAQGDPEQWDFTADVTAGRRIIRTFDGPIVAVAPLRDVYLLFGANQAHMMAFGGQFTFTTVPSLQGVGAVSAGSVVSLGSRVFGFMRDGIFETDGTGFRWVSYPQFGTWLQSNVNWAAKDKIWGWHDAEWQQIRWAIPTSGSAENNLVVVYNYISGSFSLETTAFSVGIERGVLDRAVVALIGGSVRMASSTAAPVVRWMETKPVPIGARDRMAFIDMLKLIKQSGAIRVSVATMESLNDSPEWVELGVAFQEEEDFFVSREGKYLKIRLECKATNPQWIISGLEAVGRLTGRVM